MRLDYLIRIVRQSRAKEADGRLVTSQIDLAEVYAAVRPLRGNERNQSQQTEAPAQYVFTIRRINGIHEDDVIVWQGETYNIRFVADHGPRSLYLRLEAERGVAA